MTVVLFIIAALIAVNALAALLKGTRYLVAGDRVRGRTPMQRFVAEYERQRAH